MPRIFGMSSVKMSENIDIIVQLERGTSKKVYDRLGTTEEYMQILGVKVRTLQCLCGPAEILRSLSRWPRSTTASRGWAYVPAKELMKHLGMPEELIMQDERIIEDDSWDLSEPF